MLAKLGWEWESNIHMFEHGDIFGIWGKGGWWRREKESSLLIS